MILRENRFIIRAVSKIITIFSISFACLICQGHGDALPLSVPSQEKGAVQTLLEGHSPAWRSYFKAGVIYIFPNVGFGMQYRKGNHGADISLSTFFPLLEVYGASCKGFYQYWPSSFPHFYSGVGIGCYYARFFMGIMGSSALVNTVFPSLEGMAGYEWATKKGRTLFLQIEGGTMAVFSEALLPVFSLSTGIRF